MLMTKDNEIAIAGIQARLSLFEKLLFLDVMLTLTSLGVNVVF